MERRSFTGWGRAAPSVATLASPRDAESVVGVVQAVAAAGGHLVARGLGRSYGDAAQVAGGVVVDGVGLDQPCDLDPTTGTLRVGAGVSLDHLMRTYVPQGWFVPVTPGTRYVTVGGAIAADIHGKNHHVAGAFGNHVESMDLVSGHGLLTVTPDTDPEVFWATVGGMGLTGVLTQATIAMAPIDTAYVSVDTERAADLDECMQLMIDRDDEYRYSVAWIDCVAKGKKLGRSVLTRGNHARRDEVTESDPSAFAPRSIASVPMVAPSGLLNPVTVAAFNEFWFRKAPKRRLGEIQHLAAFFHPLDGVGEWNRLYGKRGFLQYQFVVPDTATDTVRVVLERLTAARVASFLAVLKRFGPGDPAPLSFPQAGWTLALDIPIGWTGLAALLDGLDHLVAEAGGSVYLAKDSRLSPELVKVMYPKIDEWRAVRDRVDPARMFTSDLARRLDLHGPALRAVRPKINKIEAAS